MLFPVRAATVSTVRAATDGFPLAHSGEIHPVEAAALVLIVAVPIIAIVLAVVLGGRMLAKVEAEKAAAEAESAADSSETDAPEQTSE